MRSSIRRGADAHRRAGAMEQAGSAGIGKRTLVERGYPAVDRAASAAGTKAGDGPHAADRALFGAGSTAALPYRAEMEVAFGEDFSGVEVQAGRRDALSEIGARAATSAERIAFASASPDRDTVAHELAHVVQHRRHGGGSGGISRRGDASEREAEQVAAAVTAGGPAPAVQHPAVTGGSRDAEPSSAEAAPAMEVRASEPAAPAECEPPVTAEREPATPDAMASEPAAPADPAATPSTPESAPREGVAADPREATAERAGGREAAAPRAVASLATKSWLGVAFGPGTATAASAPATAATADPGAPLQALRGVKLSELDQVTRQVTAQIAGGTGNAPAAAAPAVADPPTTAAPGASTPGGGAVTTAAPAAAVAPAATPIAPRGPAPASARPAPLPAASPSSARPPRVIEHPPTPQPAVELDAVFAGPRPRLPLAGPADPAHASAAEATGLRQLDARLAGTLARSAGDLGVAALDVPIAPTTPPPALPSISLRPVTAPPVPEAPWRNLPPAARAWLDEAVASSLERRIAALTARSEADAAQTQTQLGALHASHEAQRAASYQRAQAEITALRTGGAAQVDAVRDRWRAGGQALRDQTVAQMQAERGATEVRIQDSVRAGEATSDAILAGAERDATDRRRRADARAQAILSAASARASEARGRASVATLPIARQEDEGGALSEDEASEFLEEARAEVDRVIKEAEDDIALLIKEADDLSKEELEQRLSEISDTIEELNVWLSSELDRVLGDRFIKLEEAYVGQIDVLLADVNSNLKSATDALVDGDADRAATQLEEARILNDARIERLDMTLNDVAVLSRLEDVNSALEAFNLDMSKGGWEDRDRQAALGQAIRMENAFRDADEEGLFAQAGLTAPGAAFSAIMNGGEPITLEKVNDPSKSGGHTDDAGHITFYSMSRDETEGLANSRAFHFGHEFAHAFNYAIQGAANADLSDDYEPTDAPYINDSGDVEDGVFERETILDAEGNAVAGNHVERYLATDEEIDWLQDNFPDTWQTELQARSAERGMQSGTTRLGETYPDKRMFPYQQNADPTEPYLDAEWFADLTVNWSNGTLAENAAGEAIDQWMDRHMQEWIRMQLEVTGKPPPEGLPIGGPP